MTSKAKEEKQESLAAEPVLKKHLFKSSIQKEKELSPYLIPGEVVMYHADDIFFTDRRIIKHRVDWWSQAFHHHYATFDDLDYRWLESIKAKNTINKPLFTLSIVTLLLGPVGIFFAIIPGLRWLGIGILWLCSALGIGGILLIALVLLVTSLILRDRVIEFHAHGSLIKTKHLHDDELVAIRELQHLRLRRLGLDQ